MKEVAFEMDVTLGSMLGGSFQEERNCTGKQRREEVCRSREKESVAGHVLGW